MLENCKDENEREIIENTLVTLHEELAKIVRKNYKKPSSKKTKKVKKYRNKIEVQKYCL